MLEGGLPWWWMALGRGGNSFLAWHLMEDAVTQGDEGGMTSEEALWLGGWEFQAGWFWGCWKEEGVENANNRLWGLYSSGVQQFSDWWRKCTDKPTNYKVVDAMGQVEKNQRNLEERTGVEKLGGFKTETPPWPRKGCCRLPWCAG